LIQDSLAGPIYKTETAGSIECKNRDIYFFHYLAKERSSFQGAQSLLPQSLPQGIYLAQNLAQCIFAVGAARSYREIAFAKSGQEIRKRAQREDHATLGRECEAQPRNYHDYGECPLEL
jgi:hypothetical protein